MASAAVVPPPLAQPAFSALTLFESTLLNAGMLLDSMCLDELVSALRLINNLHGQLVDVMQPTAGDVQRQLETTSRRLETVSLQLQQQPHSRKHDCPVGGGGGDSVEPSPAKKAFKDEQLQQQLQQQQQQQEQQQLLNTSIKSEGVSQDPDEDDCLLLEEESSFGPFHGGNDSSRSFHGEFDKDRMGPAASCGADIRSLLKDTYKQLRGSGPHLFDFSKPWEHPVNQNVAQSVIDHAQASSGLVADTESWKMESCRIYTQHRNPVLSNRRNVAKFYRRRAKLSRRQKAFEALLPSLGPDDLEQYRVVLTRDLTSSDEEDEDEALRVRELVWESDKVRQIKLALDDAFMRRFATVKQRTQLAKCVRDPNTRSARTIPSGTPQWAIQPAFLTDSLQPQPPE